MTAACEWCKRPMVPKTEKAGPGQAVAAAKGMCRGCYSRARLGATQRLPSSGPHVADGSSILRAAVEENDGMQGTTRYVSVEDCERVRALLARSGVAELASALGIEAFS